MCQLLGMNCAEPTDFSFSFRGLCCRGGGTDIHSHGWGLCVYGGNGLRCFHDTLPASKSPIAAFVQGYHIKTLNMMAHIRYATQGEVSLENVHPFVRVFKGIQFCFSHNGECPQFSRDQTVYLGKATPENICYHAVGDTDSEAVFCALLNAMSAEFPDGLPSLPVLHEFLQRTCQELVDQHEQYTKETGNEMPIILNFLLGCGPYTLFAYSMPGRRPGSKVWNGLHYIVRQPPFSTAKLIDDEKYEIDFSAVTTPGDRVAVITTKPLTEEPGWVEFEKGQLIMFDKGLPYLTPESCQTVEADGRGLHSRTIPVVYTKLQKQQSEPKAQHDVDNNNNNSTAMMMTMKKQPFSAPPVVLTNNILNDERKAGIDEVRRTGSSSPNTVIDDEGKKVMPASLENSLQQIAI